MRSGIIGQLRKLKGYSVAEADKSQIVVLALSDHRLSCTLASSLMDEGFETVCVSDGNELLEWLADILVEGENAKKPDLIVADINLQGRRGIDLLLGFRNSCLMTPFVLIARQQFKELASQAERMGNVVVFTKPFSIKILRSTIGLIMYILDRHEGTAKIVEGIRKKVETDPDWPRTAA